MISLADHRALFDLTGRAAIVIGAGSGIGEAAARALAAHGADVLCADIAPDALDRGLSVWVTIRLALGDPDTQHEFEEGLRAVEAVTEAHHVTGDVDYLVRVDVADLAAYDEVIRNQLARLPGQAQITSYVVTSTAIERR